MKGLWRTRRSAAHRNFRKDMLPSRSSAVTRGAPSLSSFRGACAAETCLPHVLGDAWHPVTETGRRRGLVVWSNAGHLDRQCSSKLPAGLTEAS